ncbi:uncharacterized protein LOC128233588 [Mya arenaria]|uniref:uncharacterized protein LOC128233588 n=1 Tax=Mya arenaria TaxID=6604 RepID=UPI0022E3B119|nr:uncharacterized protein LOC128233588 [Mya arenaria]
MNCLLFGLVCVSLGMLVSCEIKTYRLVHVPNEGMEIAQDIVYDDIENTVTVVIGDVSMYKGHEATVNFHDFNTGYVAFKDIRRQLCFLSTAPVPYATPDIYAKGRTNMTLDFHFEIDPVLKSHDDVIKIAGEKLANFCQHYRTFFRTLIPKGRYRRAISAVAPCSHHCGICRATGQISLV